MGNINRKQLIVSVLVLLVACIGAFIGGYAYRGYVIAQNLKAFANAFQNVDTDIETTDSNTAAKTASTPDDSEEKDYIASNLTVSVSVDEYTSFLDDENKYNGKARSLKGTIKNTGDKPIKTAELLVTFLDGNNQPIGEQTYNPLFDFNNFDDVVLKPNYSNDFEFNTDGAPAEWDGQVQYAISDITFQE